MDRGWSMKAGDTGSGVMKQERVALLCCRSKADGLPVGTLFRRSEVAIIELEDELPPPEISRKAVALFRAMAAGYQFVGYRWGHIVLKLDVQLLTKAPARCIRSCLGILTVVRQADHHLHVSLRLDRATHHAETYQRSSVLCDERRDDRVKRPLARRDDVDMARAQDESIASVLHAYAIDHDA